MSLSLEKTKSGRILLLKVLNTRLEAEAAIELKRQILRHIADGEAFIVLNLAKVEFIDSCGLGCIVSCSKAMKDKGEIVLSQVHPAVNQLFELTKMNKLFRVAATDEEALNYFNSSPRTLKSLHA